jgi:hypothetical protein
MPRQRAYNLDVEGQLDPFDGVRVDRHGRMDSVQDEELKLTKGVEGKRVLLVVEVLLAFEEQLLHPLLEDRLRCLDGVVVAARAMSRGDVVRVPPLRQIARGGHDPSPGVVEDPRGP